MLSRMQTIN